MKRYERNALSLALLTLALTVSGTGCGKSDSPASGSAQKPAPYPSNPRSALMKANDDLKDTPFTLGFAGLEEMLALPRQWSVALKKELDIEKEPSSYIVGHGFAERLDFVSSHDTPGLYNAQLISDIRSRCKVVERNNDLFGSYKSACLTARPLLKTADGKVIVEASVRESSGSLSGYVMVTTWDSESALKRFYLTAEDVQAVVKVIRQAAYRVDYSRFGRSRVRLVIGKTAGTQVIARLPGSRSTFFWGMNGEWLREIPTVVADQFADTAVPYLLDELNAGDRSRDFIR